MTFTDPAFLGFFAAFYVVFVALGNSHHRWHLRFITFASLVFYGSWDWRFLPLLLGTAMIDFTCALKIGRARERGETGKNWLLATVTSNLVVLGIFKYSNFFLDGVNQGMSWLHLDFMIPHLPVLLPLGISFYTFQSMSYTIDVYRGTMQARQDPLVFLSALSFFPHLVAGPIVRGSALIPQFERGPNITRERLRTGLLLVASGLFKKAVGDLLSPIVGAYFAKSGGDDLIAAWTGVLGFGAQVYADLAGYSDIAIGLGLLCGYDFPPNFNLPYLATSPSEYWRRWHMSLSTWLRDYLFMPLAKWRPGAVFMPIMLTMAISGLWHGAALSFVVWGIHMGLVMYLFERVHKRRAKQRRFAAAAGKTMRSFAGLSMVLSFYVVVVLGQVWFRAPSLGRALQIFRELHTGAVIGPSWDGAVDLFLVVFALVGCHFVDWLQLRKMPLLLKPVVLIPFVLFCFVSAMLSTGQTFIYYVF